MFSLVSGLYDYLFSPPTVKVALFGLNGAGKSTLAEQFKCLVKGQPMIERQIPPTTGLTMFKVPFENRIWVMWDLGGSPTMRKIWGHYARSAEAIIFVLDGKDESRLLEAKEAFFSILNNYAEGAIPPILVAVNKFDSVNDVVSESMLTAVQSWITSVLNTDIEAFSPSTGIMMAKMSAKTGNGIIDAIRQLDTALVLSDQT